MSIAKRKIACGERKNIEARDGGMVAKQKNLTVPTVAAQGGQQPCGLIIKLEKDVLWSKRGGNNSVLGYFDHMKFQPVDNWLGFSPRTTAVEFHNNGKEALEDAINESLLSMYPIKLLFPEERVMDELNQSTGLSYTSWRGDISSLLEQNAYLTVLLVNLTDEFKGEIPRDPCGEQLKRFADVIRQGKFLFPADGSGELVPYQQDWARESNFCIMPSLGYSDYGIILAEKNWCFAPVLIEFLHRAAYTRPGTSTSIPILSTDYVIPAYHSVNGKDVPKEEPCSSIQLSMRIHLRPGITMLDLKQATGDGIDVYQLSGSSDCILETTNESAFRRLLCISASSSAGNSSVEGKIRTLIVSTEASFRCPVSETAIPHENQLMEIKASDLIKAQIKNLREVLKSYWVLLRKENRHMRQFNSMWNWVTTIENICKGPHNRTLQQIMRPWLDAFTDCLRRCVEQTTEISKKTPRDEDPLRQWLEYVGDMMDIFIVEAGSLLADLSRSDCFFMESERYNHASVSSATSLLIAYNRWQNQFVKDVLAEDPDNMCRYAFLVRSGGCDTTSTNNIFHSLEPEIVKLSDGREILKESMPLITQMSEMSLFDCGGTVLRMTHECMHYCGERQRRERGMYIIQFAARNFGDQLASCLFSEENYPQLITHNLRGKFFLDDKDLTEAITAAWMHSWEQLRTRITEWIEAKLTNCYNGEDKRWSERNYMCDSLRQWMLEKLSCLFNVLSPDEKHNHSYSELAEFLCREQRIAARDFYDRCDGEIRKKNRSITCLALDRRQVDAYLRGEKDAGSLLQSVVWILNQFLINPVYKAELADLNDDSGGNDVFKTLGKVVFDCFSECFADVEACNRLQVSLVDYLLGFVFEDWNVQNAVPLEAPYHFRIPAVLHVCFRSSLDEEGTALSEDTANDIRNAVESLVKCGMVEQRKNAEQLICRTNELLKKYQELKWIAEPLEDYMWACIRHYKEQPHPNMEKYQVAFQRIRLLDSRNAGNVARLFTNLIMIGEVNSIGSQN